MQLDGSPHDWLEGRGPLLTALNMQDGATGKILAAQERVCCFTRERIVSNDNVVQWQGFRLQIHPQPRRFSFAGAKVQIHQALDGRIALFHSDTRLEHSNLVPG